MMANFYDFLHAAFTLEFIVAAIVVVEYLEDYSSFFILISR
jgi:hypothetical protein